MLLFGINSSKMKAASLGLVAALFWSVSSAQQEPRVTGLIRAASQQSPVEVIGLKRPEGSSHYPLVHLRNTSSQPSVRVWIEAIISGRNGKVYRISSNSANELWPEERSIPAGSDHWVHEVVLEPSRLVLAAKNLRSNCLQVSVLVLKIEFADGSVWNRDQGKEGISWGYPTRLDINPCEGSTASESDVGRIAGAGYRESAGSATQADGEEVQSYPFSCSLAASKDKLVAMCSP